MFQGNALFPSRHRDNVLIDGFLAIVSEELGSYQAVSKTKRRARARGDAPCRLSMITGLRNHARATVGCAARREWHDIGEGARG